MTTLSHEDVAELLGAHALDALDSAEGAAVEGHLADCVDCATELAQLRAVAGMIATTTSDVPARVWDAIAAEIATPAPLVRRHRAQRRSRHIPLRRAVLTAAAAIFAVSAASAEIVHLADHGGGASSPIPASIVSLMTALDNPHSDFGSLDSIHAHNGALARIVVTPTGQAFVFDTSLPRLAPGETYQLWALRGGHYAPVDLLGANPRTIAFRVNPDAALTYYAVTIEHAGGVEVMTHHPVAEGVVQGT